MSDPRPASTADLVKAMRILARDIQSGDGVANAAIAEAADRLEALSVKGQEAVDVLFSVASVDGSHHKQWGIDQALRHLLPPWTYAAEQAEDSWEHGIAP